MTSCRLGISPAPSLCAAASVHLAAPVSCSRPGSGAGHGRDFTPVTTLCFERTNVTRPPHPCVDPVLAYDTCRLKAPRVTLPAGFVRVIVVYTNARRARRGAHVSCHVAPNPPPGPSQPRSSTSTAQRAPAIPVMRVPWRPALPLRRINARRHDWTFCKRSLCLPTVCRQVILVFSSRPLLVPLLLLYQRLSTTTTTTTTRISTASEQYRGGFVTTTTTVSGRLRIPYPHSLRSHHSS